MKIECITLLSSIVLLGMLYAQMNPASISHNVLNPQHRTTQGTFHSSSGHYRTTDDVYFANFYTHGTIVLFSYYNGTQFSVEDEFGSVVYSGTLNRSEHNFMTPGMGFYSVTATQKYSVLIGDPFDDGTCAYFAIDQNGSAVSCTLFTVCPDDEGWEEYDRTRNVVFAYCDNTHIEIQEVGGSFYWSGTLDAEEHHEWDYELAMKYLAIYADKPVSFQHYNDQGCFVPATDGRWVGQRFLAYSGGLEWTGNDNETWSIIAIYDDTYVNFHTQPGVTIFNGTLNTGQAQTFQFGTCINLYHQYIICESDKDVFLVTAGISSSSAHLLFAPATDGRPGGEEFYVPTCGDSRIVVFGREDNTQVTVEDPWGAALLYTINSGEYLDYSCALYGQGIYHITSDTTVIVIEFSNTLAGSEFVPLYFNIASSQCPMEVHATTDENAVPYGTVTNLCASVTGAYGSVEFTWWSNPPGFSSGSQNPLTEPIYGPTWFIVNAMDTMDCSSLDSVFIFPQYECLRMPNPFTPNMDQINDYVYFTFPNMSNKEGWIYIFDLDYHEIARIKVPKGIAAEDLAHWNGLDDNGNPVTQGLYIYVIEVMDEIVCEGTVTIAR